MLRDDPTIMPEQAPVQAHEAPADALLSPLLQGPATLLNPASHPLQGPVYGVLIGRLLALTDQGSTAWVAYPGQPGHEALRARATVDLHGAHIGREVVLMCESGDVRKPIVMGLVRDAGQTEWPAEKAPATVDVDVDGQRMVVTASEQLVLRCGEASITLTKAGKVLIDGTYVLTRSSGVNRVKGGSVQLN